MQKQPTCSRRIVIKSAVFGLVTASLPNIVYAKKIKPFIVGDVAENTLPHDRYPAIELSVAAEVVGVAHFNIDRLKELVDSRPELAKANWDWGFGDWESPLAAASHVGRKDIVDYLIAKGATPSIFTFAMLGHFEIVRTMIGTYPGIQKNLGPHGISILQHAKTGLSIDGVDKAKAQLLIDYLQSLGDADGRQYLNVTEPEQAKFLGDYRYGEGKDDGFSIKLNMRKMLSLGKLGKSGGALLRTGVNEFTYQGAPSVIITFNVQNNKVLSLTITEPGLVLTARKV
jgi:hypothetical protein